MSEADKQHQKTIQLSDYHPVALFGTATLMVFAALLFTPLLLVSQLGLGENASILSGSRGLFAEGMPLIGILVEAFVLWLPVAIMGLLLVHMALCYFQGSVDHTHSLSMAHRLRQWAMPEVFLLAILVSFLKIGDMAEVHIQLGLFLFALGTALMVVTFEWMRRLHPPISRTQSSQPMRSLQAPIALGLSACILLIPANILPIMEVKMSGSYQNSNILGGVVGLIEHKMWGIAAIVFIASIMVPIGKLAALAWLCYVRSRRDYSTRNDHRLFMIIESIGKWSMLDVFLVGFLTGLIQFGDFVHVTPGPAIIPFAAAVILTIFAVEQLDLPKLLPQNTEQSI